MLSGRADSLWGSLLDIAFDETAVDIGIGVLSDAGIWNHGQERRSRVWNVESVVAGSIAKSVLG